SLSLTRPGLCNPPPCPARPGPIRPGPLPGRTAVPTRARLDPDQEIAMSHPETEERILMTTADTTMRDRYRTRLDGEPDVITREEPVVFGTADSGPYTAEELDRLERTGYLQVPDLVTPEEV